MLKQQKKYFVAAGILLAVFIVFTLMIKIIDVKAVGPQASSVGFAAINNAFHKRFGFNAGLYKLSDYLGYCAILTAVIFAVVGVIQLVKRKGLFKVDHTILALGCFYIVTLLVYLFFEVCVINLRPAIVDGVLEASYPSSHTMLAVCFMCAAIIESEHLIKNHSVNTFIKVFAILFMLFLVGCRLFSGVHWLTDIIGALLISAALVTAFYGVIKTIESLE